MLRQILTGTLVATAALTAAALEDCGRLYMVGDATPAGWTVWHPYALDLDPDSRGVYIYEGGLTEGELKFTNEVGNWGTAFAPSSGVTIGTVGIADSRLSGDSTDDRKWRVTTPGRYRLTVDVRRETINAEYLGALPECIYILGDAADCWDSAAGHPVYRRPDGKYVYQTWMFREGGSGKAFKFTRSRGAYDQVEFYVPSGARSNGDIEYVVPGHYTMQAATDAAQGPIDAFWGVADDNVMRVVVDLDRRCLDIEKVYRSYGVQSSDSHAAAPLYWMAYEECFTKDWPLDEYRFDNNVNWVAENFRDAGYEMICTDGWIEGSQTINSNGYITKYNSGWNKTLSDQVKYCEDRGLIAGFYYDPLWMPRSAWDAECRIKGRDDKRTRDIVGDTKFNDFIYWVDTDKDGAEQWVKGFVRHIINQGFKFLRIDFLNWYEDAYGTDRYQRALKWIKEEARDEIWVSLVMPNCYDTAWAEQRYGDMFRISEDVFGGGIDFVSGRRRGVYQSRWANWGNIFDGFIYFSGVDRNRAVMDGDFVRLNTCSTDNERRFWLSLLVMAGSPVSIADQYDSPNIDNFKHLYCNAELISLAREGFYARPLSKDLSDIDNSSVWHGTTVNGEHVVGLFNREDASRTVGFDLSRTGHEYAVNIRDLWSGEKLANCSGRIEMTLKPHSCSILRFRAADSADNVTMLSELDNIYIIGSAAPSDWVNTCSYLLTETADGIFVYEGGLAEGEFKFITRLGEWTPAVMPTVGGTTVSARTLEACGIYVSENGDPDNKWNVATAGNYRLTVDTRGGTLKAEYLGAMPQRIYALGASTTRNDSNHGLFMSRRADGKYVWEGIVTYSDDDKCIKFTLDRGDWDKVTFIVPESVDHNGNVRIVTDGTYKAMRSAETDPGALKDWFWGIPKGWDGIWRFTVDPEALTVEVKRVKGLPGKFDPIAVTELYMNGLATGSFDSGNPGAQMTAKGNGVFEWEGNMDFAAGDGVADHANKQFKFLTSKGDWDKVWYLVPSAAQADGYVEQAESGKTYTLSPCSWIDGRSGVDAFFGLTPGASDKYTVRVDVPAMTMTLTGSNTTAVGTIDTDSEEILGVYTVDGREVSRDNLSAGIYIVRTNKGVKKIIRK